MWENLRNRQICGVKFRRQYSVDYMILDFYCPRLKLAIELDGSQHQSEYYLKRDAFRDKYLMTEFGITVLRIPNSALDEDILNVIHEIERTVGELLELKEKPPKSSL